MTPHISAKKDDIAKLVIMPGDPKRAKFIAENYLKEYKLVNDVRGMLGYTGLYNGKKVTVMASGLGIPSMGIYAYELFNFYNVEKIIRVGSCKSLQSNIALNDMILVTSSYTMSSFSYGRDGSKLDLIEASSNLNAKIKEMALKLDFPLFTGKIYTSDVFYAERESLSISDLLGVEMESFALFYEAYKKQKEASCILTVSDTNYSSDALTSEEREKSFSKAILLALESIIY